VLEIEFQKRFIVGFGDIVVRKTHPKEISPRGQCRTSIFAEETLTFYGIGLSQRNHLS
jgi:hypothetical protein